tara:strand:- start:408 stop:731 length:324 start_codon:yes stop_codon:yes gene_type:complete
MNKEKEPRPDIYRLTFKPGMWKTRGERFFNTFSAGEALDDLYHAFAIGKVDADCLTVVSIESWNRFSNKWECRQIEAIKETTIKPPQMSIKGKCVYICHEEKGSESN